jgi:hypothetical protein
MAQLSTVEKNAKIFLEKGLIKRMMLSVESTYDRDENF